MADRVLGERRTVAGQQSGVSAIEAIEKAMEGVTPGQWYPGHLGTDSTCQCRSIVDEGIYMGAIATVHVDNGLPIVEGGNDAPPAEEAAANMRYIAACNPVAISELLALARQAEALQRENAELRKKLEACDWYWPEDDTSSDACADSPWQIAENYDLPPGEVLAYSRGGVVETRYYAYLPPADDADSDDQFEVDAETELAVKQAIEAETARRARALLGGENAE